MKKLVTFRIGEESRNWETKELGYNGNDRQTNIFSTEEKIRLVLQLLEIKHWKLYEATERDGYKSEAYEAFDKSQSIKDYENKKKNESEEYNKKQNEKCKKINTLPKKFKVENNIPGFKLVIERSEYTFSPTRSSSIQGGLTWKTPSERSVFHHKNYLTGSGAFQNKKFTEDLHWNFGITEKDVLKYYSSVKEFFIVLKEEYKKVNGLIKNI